jgi:hypothetical protein
MSRLDEVYEKFVAGTDSMTDIQFVFQYCWTLEELTRQLEKELPEELIRRNFLLEQENKILKERLANAE